MICGGRDFVAGPNGRLARGGQPPRCASCGSLERHRIVRGLFDALDADFFSGRKVLQFSPDPATPADRFATVEISVHGGSNSLDLAAIDRPDGMYDWVVANHVIEHVEDDLASMREMLRVIGPSGVVQLTAPSPSTRLWTDEWGYPDPADHGHYRIYGCDLPIRLAPAIGAAVGLQAIGRDQVTGRRDVVYFFTPDKTVADRLAGCLRAADFPVLLAHGPQSGGNDP